MICFPAVEKSYQWEKAMKYEVGGVHDVPRPVPSNASKLPFRDFFFQNWHKYHNKQQQNVHIN
jgi:hypothetical protein